MSKTQQWSKVHEPQKSHSSNSTTANQLGVVNIIHHSYDNSCDIRRVYIRVQMLHERDSSDLDIALLIYLPGNVITAYM